MKFWKVNFHWLEPLVVLLVSIGAAVWLERSGRGPAVDALVHGNRAAIYGTLASVFGALLGFIVTAVSIILAFSSAPGLAVVRGSKHYPTLYKAFFVATWVLGAACLAALVALIWDRDNGPCRLAFYATGALALTAIVAIVRSIWLLERISLLACGPPSLQGKP